MENTYLGLTLKGRYVIEKELGRGGIGVVYLAHDQCLMARPVVVKVLLDDSFQSPWARQKFTHEVEALARIEHPGIVGVLDQGEMPDNRPYFVMQFVEGATLRSLLSEQTLPLEQVAYLIQQLGRALTVVHEKGIFHRDLKPENIMVQALGHGDIQVKIIDFGLAKLENPLTSSGSVTGVLAGTLNYMAPEQLMAHPCSAASDVYALGLIAYEMLTGQRPFQPLSLFQLYELQRNMVLESPRTFRPELGEASEHVIRRALAFEPQHRFSRARDFGDDLARALTEASHAVQEDSSGARGRRDDLQWPIRISEDPAGGAGVAARPTADARPPQATLSWASQMPGQQPTALLASEEEMSPKSSTALPTPQMGAKRALEAVNGAVPLASEFYIVRPTDEEFQGAIARHDSIVLVKGARQMGKTSLLARGLQLARERGARVALTDFQKLNNDHLESAEALYMALGQLIADQLDLDIQIEDVWNARRGANIAFDRFLRREILARVSQPIVWGLDEVDRLFTCSFGSEVFGLFRSWHNERALDPTGPWQRLTLAIAYATEAHLFITDMNQSPFNVGTRLALEDFDSAQVAELNLRYESPLRSSAEIARFMALVGGHPYLVRRGLQELVTRKLDISWLEAQAGLDEGPFGDHLRRMLVLLAQDQALSSVVRCVLQGKPCPTSESFYRLRSAGVIAGHSSSSAKPRCQLYTDYLGRHLSA